MKIFKTKPENLSVSLKKASENALNCFHQVMNDLKAINESSSIKQEELTIEVQKINLEISELEQITIDNNKVIINIEKILK